MQTILGRRVQISAAYPRMQVSEALARILTPEVLAETNAWMVSFFGYRELLPDGVVYELHGHTLLMNRATYDKAMVAINRPTTPGGAA